MAFNILDALPKRPEALHVKTGDRVRLTRDDRPEYGDENEVYEITSVTDDFYATMKSETSDHQHQLFLLADDWEIIKKDASEFTDEEFTETLHYDSPLKPKFDPRFYRVIVVDVLSYENDSGERKSFAPRTHPIWQIRFPHRKLMRERGVLPEFFNAKKQGKADNPDLHDYQVFNCHFSSI